ncbi:MAG TPA: outer membrane beta-barrel protein [Opitutaceae bacterium]|nr:outer membrane beta-barrel protein [Opitutaceae bacterium]
MNKSIRFALITASIVAVGRAAPFMAVGDGAELFATGVVGVRADDNIFLSNSKTSDTIFDVTPGLELDFGKNAQTQGSLTLADNFSMYTQHSGLNTNLFQGDFVTRYDDGKMKMGFDAGYHELNQNTVDVRAADTGRLIRRDIGTADANGEVGVSEITAIGAAVQYRHEYYHPAGYISNDQFTVPVNFYYKWTPKVDLSLGYQYHDFQAKSGSALDSTDNFYNIGARGEFTPKLTGTFRVGYTERRFSGNQSNQNLFGLDASFAYEFSPKTTVQFGATNDFGTAPQGQQQKNLTGNVLVTTKINEEFSVNVGLSYRGITYYGLTGPGNRTDDYWEGTIGGAYTINANLRLVGAYTYRNYKTDIAGSEFNNNVLSVAANFRY